MEEEYEVVEERVVRPANGSRLVSSLSSSWLSSPSSWWPSLTLSKGADEYARFVIERKRWRKKIEAEEEEEKEKKVVVAVVVVVVQEEEEEFRREKKGEKKEKEEKEEEEEEEEKGVWEGSEEGSSSVLLLRERRKRVRRRGWKRTGGRSRLGILPSEQQPRQRRVGGGGGGVVGVTGGGRGRRERPEGGASAFRMSTRCYRGIDDDTSCREDRSPSTSSTDRKKYEGRVHLAGWLRAGSTCLSYERCS